VIVVYVPFSHTVRGARASVRPATRGAWLYSLGRYAIAEALRWRARRGGMVLIPALACAALVDAVRASGHDVRFFDVSADLSIGPEEVLPRLTRETVAVVAISYFGWETVKVKALREAMPPGLFVLVDAAHSVPLPTHDLSLDRVYSFRKSLGVAEGACWVSHAYPPGAQARPPRAVSADVMHEDSVLSKLSDMAGVKDPGHISRLLVERRRIQKTRGFAWDRAAPSLTTHATWLSADFEALAEARRRCARRYMKLLWSCAGARPVFGEVPLSASPLGFPIRVSDAASTARALWRRAIETSRWWSALPAGATGRAFPRSRAAAGEILQLPVHAGMSDADLERVALAVIDACRLRPRGRSKGSAVGVWTS
jgi:hypothetical protein